MNSDELEANEIGMLHALLDDWLRGDHARNERLKADAEALRDKLTRLLARRIGVQ